MSEDSRKVSRNRLATWGVRQARHSRSVSTSWGLSRVSTSGGRGEQLSIANTQITKTVHNKMLHSDDLTVHYIYTIGRGFGASRAFFQQFLQERLSGRHLQLHIEHTHTHTRVKGEIEEGLKCSHNMHIQSYILPWKMLFCTHSIHGGNFKQFHARNTSHCCCTVFLFQNKNKIKKSNQVKLHIIYIPLNRHVLES